MLCSWDVGSLKCQRDVSGFVPYYEVKRGLFHNRVEFLVMTEFHEGIQMSPRFWIVRTEDPGIDFKFLIYPFCFSISLWVVVVDLIVLILRNCIISRKTWEVNCEPLSERKEVERPNRL